MDTHITHHGTKMLVEDILESRIQKAALRILLKNLDALIANDIVDVIVSVEFKHVTNN